jgi:hypothetical protein
MRALVAVEHALVITAWNILTDGAFYRELGADYYTVRNPQKSKPARSVNSKRSATPSRSHHSPRPHNQQPAVHQWSPARSPHFSYQRDHRRRQLVRRGMRPSGPISQTGQPFGLVSVNPRMHRLPRRAELPGHLRFRDTVEHLQNGAIPVLGHPIAGTPGSSSPTGRASNQTVNHVLDPSRIV